MLIYPGQKKDLIYDKIERKINKQNYKYLLKYDKVKVVSFFSTKILSIQELEADEDVLMYLSLKSKQRLLKRVKSKIARFNKYYNQPTELWARSFECYVMERNYFVENCPNLASLYDQLYNSVRIPCFTEFVKKILYIS